MVNANTRGRARRFVAPALLFFFASFFLASTEGCQVISGLNGLEATERAPVTTCEPLATRSCYSGPEGTEGVGLCEAGTQACKADGSGWEACSGDVKPDPKPENCVMGVDANCDEKDICTGATVWSWTGGSNDKIFTYGVAVDSQGDVIVVGAFWGVATIGGKMLDTVDEYADGFVAKLGPTGEFQWVQHYSGVGQDSVNAVAVTPDDFILVAGHYTATLKAGDKQIVPAGGGGDVFVAKLDKDGSTIWTRSAGDSSSQAAIGVASDNLGNAVVTGQFNGVIDFGAGPLTADGTDGFVVKLDAASNTVWSRSISGSGEQMGNGVAVDSAGDVVVTGKVTGNVNFVGDMLAVGPDPLIFAGKLGGEEGGVKWAKLFGAPHPSNAGFTAARAGLEREVVIAGQFGGTSDFGSGPAVANAADAFIVKLDYKGDIMWGRTLGNGGDDVVHKVAADLFGNVAVAGEFADKIALGGNAPDIFTRGANDGFIAKLAADGTPLWAIGAGGSGADAAYGVAVDRLGAVYATGFNGDMFLIGSTDVPAKYPKNIFATKLDP